MGVGAHSCGVSRTPRRAYYPSGPWIDGIRPADSPASPPPPPQGNPDPNNYKIIKAEELGSYLIVKINYPNCTNFEGNKILVFKDMTLISLVNQKVIDPHFFKDSRYAAPIARFVPTDEGWQMARALCAALNLMNEKD